MSAGTPVVWAVLGDKAGDNAQIEAVVDRLPWPVARKRLHFRWPFRTGKPLPLASLYHLDRRRSDPLEPPWPDLVLTIGQRAAMAAMWVRKRSGERTRVILFGRPKRDLNHFALVVASTQYRIPAAPNVLATALPLMRIDTRRVDAARAEWANEFEHVPRPLVGVLVGGATRPYALGAAEASRLLQVASSYARGGTLYVTTSRRTGSAALATLAAELPERARLWRWGEPSPNPYLGLLAWADVLIVTGDSMSMITEVATLNRPLVIYPLPLSGLRRWARRRLPARLADLPRRLKFDCLPRLGFVVYERDLGAIHRRLVADGRAAFAGEGAPEPTGSIADDAARVARAIVDLTAASDPAKPATIVQTR
jgi:mitochondrial fission protein ELM1